MDRESPREPLDAFMSRHAALLESVCAGARCARWGLPRERFAEALRRSAAKRFGGMPVAPGELGRYLHSLHLEDLALACACSEGIEGAWEFFVAHFRQGLRGAARAILHAAGSSDQARAEELADSLYADLYGLSSPRGERRKSLFEYFHGRSKLSTWLRAVLAQRHIDLLRTGRKMVSLEGENKHARRLPAQTTDPAPSDPDRERYVALLDQALSTALAALAPRERMLLACSYVDQMTLAEIGRITGEHESTISRQLNRLRRSLGEQVTRILQQATPARDGHLPGPGLDGAQVEMAFQYALEQGGFDLSRALSKAPAAAEPREK